MSRVLLILGVLALWAPVGAEEARFQVRLFDGSAAIDSRADFQGNDVSWLAGVEVQVESYDASGQSGKQPFTTDGTGLLTVVIPDRRPHSEVLLHLEHVSGRMVSTPLSLQGVRKKIATGTHHRLPMYRIARDDRDITEHVVRMVAENPDAAGSIRVDQIVTLENGGSEVYFGPFGEDGLPRVTYRFPVLVGAQMQKFSVGGAEASSVPDEDAEHGYGIPVQTVLYPKNPVAADPHGADPHGHGHGGAPPEPERHLVRIEGSFAAPAAAGTTLDLGIKPTFHIEALLIGLQNRAFQFVGGGPGLNPIGPLEFPGVPSYLSWWSVRKPPVKSAIECRARFVDPGVRIRARLMDGSRALEASHRSQGGEARPSFLAMADVTVQVIGGAGKPRTWEARTDMEGLLDLDLGVCDRNAQLLIRARSGEQIYYAPPVSTEEVIGRVLRPQRMRGAPLLLGLDLYRGTASSMMVQTDSLNRIVTENEDLAEKVEFVHVRQIMSVVNGGFEVYLGPGGLEPGSPTLVCPVPEGAEVIQMVVSTSEWSEGRWQPAGSDSPADLTPRRVGATGVHGVPIFQALYPRSRLQIMCTYKFDVRHDAEIDLSWHSDFAVSEYVLALQHRRFEILGSKESFYETCETCSEPTETARVRMIVQGPPSGDEFGLTTDNMPTSPPGVSQAMVIWRAGQWQDRSGQIHGERIPIGSIVPARIRFGDPGIETTTWLMILAWVGGIGGALFFGLWIAGVARKRSRGESAVTEQLQALEELYMSGEIDADEYRREEERLRAQGGPALGAEAREVIEELAGRLNEIASGDSKDLSREIATLSSSLRERLSR